MINNWGNEIVVMNYVKQELKKLDNKGVWPYYLPEIAATEEQLIEIEKHLGYNLDNNYRNFLKFANGWKGFYQTVDLFGTKDLVCSRLMDNAYTILENIEDDIIESSGLSREELLPIAATIYDKDLFVLTLAKSNTPGIVIWFAGEEIDRFLSFDEYFLSMVDYNRLMIQRFSEGN